MGNLTLKSNEKIRWIILLSLILILNGCMLNPGNGVIINSSDTEITFSGFGNQPKQKILLKARNPEFKWEIVGETYTHSVPTTGTKVNTGEEIIDVHLYSWSLGLKIPTKFWVRTPIGLYKTEVKSSILGSFYLPDIDLKSFDIDWSACFLQKNSIKQFYDECYSQNSPLMEIFARNHRGFLAEVSLTENSLMSRCADDLINQLTGDEKLDISTSDFSFRFRHPRIISAYNHTQGVGRLRNWNGQGRMIISDNSTNNGFWVAFQEQNDASLDLFSGNHRLINEISFPIRFQREYGNHSHPGGLQAHGDLVVVAMEDGNYVSDFPLASQQVNMQIIDRQGILRINLLESTRIPFLFFENRNSIITSNDFELTFNFNSGSSLPFSIGDVGLILKNIDTFEPIGSSVSIENIRISNQNLNLVNNLLLGTGINVQEGENIILVKQLLGDIRSDPIRGRLRIRDLNKEVQILGIGSRSRDLENSLPTDLVKAKLSLSEGVRKTKTAAGAYFLKVNENRIDIISSVLKDGTHGENSLVNSQSAENAGFLRLSTGRYLLAINGKQEDEQVIWFYESIETEITPSTTWKFINTFTPELRGFGSNNDNSYNGASGGLNLIAGCLGEIYLLAFQGTKGLRPHEALQIFRLSRTQDQIQLTKVIQQKDNMRGFAIGNRSFRWSGGSYVSDIGILSVFNTERNTRKGNRNSIDGHIYNGKR